jgi:hypothetical protein
MIAESSVHMQTPGAAGYKQTSYMHGDARPRLRLCLIHNSMLSEACVLDNTSATSNLLA